MRLGEFIGTGGIIEEMRVGEGHRYRRYNVGRGEVI